MRNLAILQAISSKTHFKASREAGRHLGAPFNKGGGWGGGSKATTYACSPQRHPHRKRKGENTRRTALTLSSLRCCHLFFFFSVCLFLLSSQPGNCRGREIGLLVSNIIGLGCSVHNTSSPAWDRCSGGAAGNSVNIFSLQRSSVLSKGLITDTKDWII